MLSSKKAKKVLSLFVTILMVLGSFTSFAYAEGNQLSSAKLDLREEALKKINPEVMIDLEDDDVVEVLVYMKEQVDTEMVAYATRNAVSSYMTPYSTKLEVRKGVVEALRDKAELTQASILNYLEQEKENGNVTEYKPYHIVNMLYVKGTKDVIENISYMAEVEKIYKNKTYQMDISVTGGSDVEPQGTEPEWNIIRVGADEAWNLGYDGTGIVVGSLDSGVDWTHPALKEHWRGYDPNTGATDPSKSWFDPVYGASLPADSDSHGTHVMGTIVGQEPDGSNPVGVAPGARWITARVFNTAGSTTDRILLDSAEWMLHPDGDPTAAPDVVNNSWGGLDGIDDWYREAVRAWRAAEIFPVFSAGNQRAGEPLPWPGSISCPANYPESFAVAAVNRYDERASFSKLGPSPYDPTAIKPNISAPGVNIYSSIPGGYTSGYSGTSMSAPHITGTVALLLSANASLTLEDIEEIITTTAEPLTDSTYPNAPNFGYGYGMVNAFEAVSSVATGTGYITGRVLIEGSDNELPEIYHEQTVTEAYAGSDIAITAEISDDVSITEAELLVKQAGKSYWYIVPMNRIAGDYKSGTYQGTITYDLLVGDSLVYKIRATDFVGDTVMSKEYRIDLEFGIIPGEYSQGFENDITGWIMEGVWEWGAPSGTDPAPYEGASLAGTVLGGPYASSADDWMITPPIDLRDENVGANLVFQQWYELENNYDKGYILMTNDYGASWIQAGAVITGNATNWSEISLDLSQYAGSPDPVFVAFRFTSDSSVTRRGWYIDDMHLEATEAEYTPPSDGYIIYDDGIAENALVLNDAGNGCAVKFIPDRMANVTHTDIFIWGNDWPSPGGNRLGFVVYDEAVNQVGEPIFIDNLVRGDWTTIDLSSFNFTTDKMFYISTIQDTVGTSCPGTGIDTDSWYSAYSYANIDGAMIPLAEADIEGSFMIRAYVDYLIDDPEDLESSNNEVVQLTSSKPISNAKGKLATNINKVATKEGYVAPSSPKFSLKRAEENKYETITDRELNNTLMIYGGVPAADAVITILETGRSVKVNPATGRFSMRVPMGDYTLRAEAYGYFAEDVEVSVIEDDTVDKQFFLEPIPRGTIAGRVVDRYYGDPASYALIRVVEDPKVEPVIADADGYFTIPDVLIGDYTLKVTADGFEPGEFQVTVSADEVTNVELGLKIFVGYEAEIVYDDGTAENALVLNAAPNGLAVRFTPEQFGKVTGVNTFVWGADWPSPGGTRLGYTIYGTNENGTPYKVGEPIFVDVVRGEWNYIDLSSFGFSTDKDFYISTIQDRVGTSCPGTGIDESSPYGDRSYMNLDGTFELLSSEDIAGGLMMRAIVENSVSTPVITNLEEVNYTNQDTITVEGTVETDCTVNIYVNGEMTASANTEFLEFAVNVELPLDENEIMVTAEMDGRQTEPCAPVIVIKDKVSPVLVIDEPSDNAKINAEVVHVIGSANDNIEVTRVLINEEEAVLNENGSFHERIMLDKGENTITVKAIDVAGNETIITRTVTVVLAAPEITDMMPDEDIELYQGDTLEVSFISEPGGEGYFRVVLDIGPAGTTGTRIPMVEVEPGFYVGTWKIPRGFAIRNGLVELEFIDEAGNRIADTAPGRVTIYGISMDELPSNSVIIGDEAFDIRYLEANANVQAKMDSWNGPVFIKLDANTIVDADGELVDFEEALPDILTYYGIQGNGMTYEKLD